MKKIFVLIFITFLFVLTGCSLFNNNVYGCTGCVYTYTKDTKEIGNVLTKYNSNYSTINHKIFLGYKLEKNNKILAGYVCGKENGKTFCIEGNFKESKYEENKKILNKVYDKEKCEENKYGDDLYYGCSGEIDVSISNNGTNYISISKSDQCYVNADGKMYCYFN